MGVTKVTRWQTSDGIEHFNEQLAQCHEGQLDQAIEATNMFKNGDSIGKILDAFSLDVPDDIIYKVNKSTQLVIRHWQCRDTPGYKPICFKRGLNSMHVYGNAGSWSGGYGGEVPIKDIVRYAKDKNTILGV